ncbi:MAG: hypothetical protein EBY16_00095 [Gammaproteobacteria bacterium]|nr:hypothetical protein [Gammaproteobacteria bacterium]
MFKPLSAHLTYLAHLPLQALQHLANLSEQAEEAEEAEYHRMTGRAVAAVSQPLAEAAPAAEAAKLIEPTHIFILAGVVAVGFFICESIINAQLNKPLAGADPLLANAPLAGAADADAPAEGALIKIETAKGTANEAGYLGDSEEEDVFFDCEEEAEDDFFDCEEEEAPLAANTGGNQNQTILQMIVAFFSNILKLLTSFSWFNPKLVAGTNENAAQVSSSSTLISLA